MRRWNVINLQEAFVELNQRVTALETAVYSVPEPKAPEAPAEEVSKPDPVFGV